MCKARMMFVGDLSGISRLLFSINVLVIISEVDVEGEIDTYPNNIIW